MNRLIGSDKIATQLKDIQNEFKIDTSKQPILLQISEGVYIISYSRTNEEPHVNATLSTSPMHIISKTKFLESHKDTDQFGDSSPVLQFDDGYLVLTVDGYKFTPYLFQLGSCIPYTPVGGKQSVEVSLLIGHQSITMTTAQYATLELPTSEWEQLGENALVRIVSEVLRNGRKEEKYTTREDESEACQNTSLYINGEEHAVTLNQNCKDLMKDFLDKSVQSY